jgi:PadR family transcriptional regulator, regulatory protein AphA
VDPNTAKSPEFALLGFLRLQPSHGYELHQRLSRELGYIWNVSQSETYNILKRLETEELIRSKVIAQEKLPARRLLSLSPAGRLHFDTWLKTPSGSSARAIRLEFMTRLYFARQIENSGVQSMLDQEIWEVRASLRKMEGILIDMPISQTFNRLGLEYQILQRKATLDWLETFGQTLNLQLYSQDQSESLLAMEDEMKLSARNVLKGKVIKIVTGAVNAEVTVQLPGGEQLISIITNTSVESLKLKEGQEAYAIVKASNVMIGIDEVK